MKIRAMVALGSCLALFSFLGAAQTCDDPSTECGREVSTSCLQRAGAGVLSAGTAPAETDVAARGGDCARQFDRYRQCLAAIAQRCGVAPSPAPARIGGCTEFREQALFQAAQADPAQIAAFRATCPNSPLLSLLRGGAAGAGADVPNVAPSNGEWTGESNTLQVEAEIDGDRMKGVIRGRFIASGYIRFEARIEPDGTIRETKVRTAGSARTRAISGVFPRLVIENTGGGSAGGGEIILTKER